MTKYGLELVLKQAKPNQPSDVVFAVVHWVLTSGKKFGSVGIGENFDASDSQPSELLPINWNIKNNEENGPYYVVRYRQKETNQKYVLKMVHSAGVMWQIILCRCGDDKMASMSADISKEVSDSDGFPFKDLDKVCIFNFD